MGYKQPRLGFLTQVAMPISYYDNHYTTSSFFKIMWRQIKIKEIPGWATI